MNLVPLFVLIIFQFNFIFDFFSYKLKNIFNLKTKLKCLNYQHYINFLIK